MKVLILHGNFESEEDWKEFLYFLEKKGIESTFFNVWNFFKNHDIKSWDSFVHEFSKIYPTNSFDCSVGYSLGGRILLSLLNSGWSLKKVIFLSTHPGLSTEEERNLRIWNDLKWKEKVLSCDWKELFEEWNAQEVFQEDKACSFETFFPLQVYRSEIAQAFDILSLGRSQGFTQRLANLSQAKELHWGTGELDSKFSALAKDLSQKAPAIHFKSFTGVGHRIHRSNPHVLAELVSLF